MTSVNKRKSPRAAAALRRQARYWDRRYRADPTLFGAEGSAFLNWVLASLEGRPTGRTWLELGSGYGRDLRALRDRGYRVQGVDLSKVGISLSRRSGLDAVLGPATRFLAARKFESVDVVFSNLFLNMDLSEQDHDRLFSLVYRALVPGGYHAYSVRSVSDRWYGKGVPRGADTFDLTPDGPVMHFFSRAYARRLRRGRFRSIRSWEGTEDPGGFPVRVLYILEQKPRSSRNERRT